MEKLLKKKNDNLPSVLSDFFDTDNFFNMSWLDKAVTNRVPAVNIVENGKEFRIELAAPGFTRDSFKVNVENDVLTISAEKKEEKTEEKERYTRREYAYDSFTRSFTLPQSANGEQIDAKYADGILKLRLPKRAEAKSTLREVKVS